VATEQQGFEPRASDESTGRGWMVMLAVLTIVGIIVWLVIANGEDTD
jgi:uncharacterized membrane protein